MPLQRKYDDETRARAVRPHWEPIAAMPRPGATGTGMSM
jgi:hypothetical protein